MAALATIATIAGTAISALGTIAAGSSKQAAGRWQQAEFERQAQAELAAAQRDAEARHERKRAVQSELQATAAASGLSATDPTTLQLVGDIERYGTLQEQMAMYAGEDRATGMRAKGALARFSGDAERLSSIYQGIGTIVGGVGEGLSRYRGTGRGSTRDSYQGWG